MWTTHNSFLPMVSASWSLHVTAGNPIQRVTQKLKRFKFTLMAWNRDTFRNVYVVMEEAPDALNAIYAETALLGDIDDRLLAEIECTIHLNTALTQHQDLSTQRNRLQWLQNGDRNSKFFHTMNRIRKTSIGLSSLLIGDVLFFNPEDILDRVL
ncbi:hypothetical protein ACS0TY_035064 [Phlomoides rotata]